METYVDRRDLTLQCAYLEERVQALSAALERQRQLNRDLERTLEHFVTQTEHLREQLKLAESMTSF